VIPVLVAVWTFLSLCCLVAFAGSFIDAEERVPWTVVPGAVVVPPLLVIGMVVCGIALLVCAVEDWRRS